MLKSLLERIYQYRAKRFFSTGNRKFVVFCSDDWGGVRVKSSEDQKALSQAGIKMDSNRFDLYDTLESNADLEELFNVLVKYKDHNGHHPVITAVSNVANPDFERIRDSGFNQYFYETTDLTLKRYPAHDKVIDLYKEGIRMKIFFPQYHGREHVQVARWLKYLRNGNEKVRRAFNHDFFMLGQSSFDDDDFAGFGTAYDFDDRSEIADQRIIVKDGLSAFKKLFGYEASYFTAPGLVFHSDLETAFLDTEVSLIDVAKIRSMPLGNRKTKRFLNFTGQRTASGKWYIVRNAVFETNIKNAGDGVDACLQGIGKAFRFNQPAIISNHRASFVGGLDSRNRDRGLRSLDSLLRRIIKEFPDVEFVSIKDLNQAFFEF